MKTLLFLSASVLVQGQWWGHPRPGNQGNGIGWGPWHGGNGGGNWGQGNGGGQNSGKDIITVTVDGNQPLTVTVDGNQPMTVTTDDNQPSPPSLSAEPQHSIFVDPKFYTTLEEAQEGRGNGVVRGSTVTMVTTEDVWTTVNPPETPPETTPGAVGPLEVVVLSTVTEFASTVDITITVDPPLIPADVSTAAPIPNTSSVESPPRISDPLTTTVITSIRVIPVPASSAASSEIQDTALSGAATSTSHRLTINSTISNTAVSGAATSTSHRLTINSTISNTAVSAAATSTNHGLTINSTISSTLIVRISPTSTFNSSALSTSIVAGNATSSALPTHSLVSPALGSCSNPITCRSSAACSPDRKCLCQPSVDGVGYCLADTPCSTLRNCTTNADCGTGSTCMITCCNTHKCLDLPFLCPNPGTPMRLFARREVGALEELTTNGVGYKSIVEKSVDGRNPNATPPGLKARRVEEEIDWEKN